MSARSSKSVSSDRDEAQKDEEHTPTKARTWAIGSWSRDVNYRLMGRSDADTRGSKSRTKWFAWPSRWKPSASAEGEEWIQGGRICTLAATTILCLNVILVIVAAALGSSRSGGDSDYASMPIYRGSCSVSQGWATGLHAFINMVSTGLLAASNFVMQCLGAPSRQDITRAHGRRKWLDIGTYSIRNFSWMDTKRKVLWSILLVTSLFIHLLYNSVVYNSISSSAYGTIILPPDLTPDEELVSDKRTSEVIESHLGYSIADLKAQLFNGTFHDLNQQECIDKYAVELNTQQSTLVLVADREYFHNTSILRTVAERAPWPNDVSGSGYRYLCDSTSGCTKEELQNRIQNHKWVVSGQQWLYPDWKFGSPEPGSYEFQCDYISVYSDTPDMDAIKAQLCSYIADYNPTLNEVSNYLATASNWNNKLAAKAADISIESHRPLQQSGMGEFQPRIPITSCKSKPGQETCQLNFSWLISLIVIICNTIKVLCMYLATRKKRKNILLTVGDAISTFLGDPDPTTKGRCMMTRASITYSWVHDLDRRDRSTPLQASGAGAGTDTPSSEKPPGGHMGASKSCKPDMLPLRHRWWSAVGWKRWTIVILLFVSCLAVSVFLVVFSIGAEPSNSWRGEFGDPTSQTTLTLTTDVVQLALLTNSPQIVLSMLYFVYNNSLTCMVLGAEYTSYALQRKPLRVSWPRGEQRSTYYLSLPYRYSVPFMVVSATLHWLLSQSFFLVQVQQYDVRGNLVGSTKGCGYSSVPMLATATLGFVSTVVLLGLGIRPYRSQMPLAGHCSAALSAACHPPADDVDPALKPVMWGEVFSPVSVCSSLFHSSTSSDDMARNNPGILESVPGYGHCTFTSREVSTPRDIRLYA